MRFSADASSNLIRVKDAKNDDTGEYINDATVTCTVTDSGGSAVTGQTWPLTLAYKTGSNGVYRGILLDTADLTPGSNYLAKITFVGAGVKKYWEVPFQNLIDTGDL